MLFSPNQLLLCKLFAFYPDRSFYMQEIGRILEKKPGVFQRMLNILEKEGFVKSEFKANARFFQLNPDYGILKEIQGILKKTSPDNPFKDKVNGQVSKKKPRSDRQKKARKESPASSLETTNALDPKPAPETHAPKLATRFSDLREEKMLTRLKPTSEVAHSETEPVPEAPSRKLGQKRQLELF